MKNKDKLKNSEQKLSTLEKEFEWKDHLKRMVNSIADERIQLYLEPEQIKSNTFFKTATETLAKIENKQNDFFKTIKDFIEVETEKRISRTVRKSKPNVFAGFHLTEKWSIVNGDKTKKNYVWYATRTLNGKRIWIYVGKKKGEAKRKIQDWLKKKPEVAKFIKEDSINQ